MQTHIENSNCSLCNRANPAGSSSRPLLRHKACGGVYCKSERGCEPKSGSPSFDGLGKVRSGQA